MADIPVTGILPETDAIGEGAGAPLEDLGAPLVCFYINTFEEVLSFLGQQPAPPIGGDPEEVPEGEPGDEEPVTIRTTAYEVNEDAGSVIMTFLRRNPRPERSLEFQIIAVPGSALPGQHYQDPAAPLEFAAGETLIQSTLSILDSNIGTGVTKQLKVRLAAPPSQLAYTRGPISEASVKIIGVGPIGG